MTGLSKDIIYAVQKAGFDVYMRKPTDTWLIFTDDQHLGYLQDGWRGIATSTVHKPNPTTGTGYGMDEFMMVADLTADKLRRAFRYAPEWASQRDTASVHKYKGIEDYKASHDGYEKVE